MLDGKITDALERLVGVDRTGGVRRRVDDQQFRLVRYCVGEVLECWLELEAGIGEIDPRKRAAGHLHHRLVGDPRGSSSATSSPS